MGKDDDADIEALVGVGAYLTIEHNVGKDGKTYANVDFAGYEGAETWGVGPAAAAGGNGGAPQDAYSDI